MKRVSYFKQNLFDFDYSVIPHSVTVFDVFFFLQRCAFFNKLQICYRSKSLSSPTDFTLYDSFLQKTPSQYVIYSVRFPSSYILKNASVLFTFLQGLFILHLICLFYLSTFVTTAFRIFPSTFTPSDKMSTLIVSYFLHKQLF